MIRKKYKDGATQRRTNPMLVLGAKVIATPNEIDALISNLDRTVEAVIVGYLYQDYLKLEILDTKARHIFHIQQVELIK